MTFDAPIIGGPRGYAYVLVPPALDDALGPGRVPVAATLDGCPYDGTVMPVGAGRRALLVVKHVREHIGKGPGDTVSITLTHNRARDQVALPDDLAAALTPSAHAFFDTLTPGRRRAWVQWVESAKRPTMRERRIAHAAEQLAARRAER